MSWVLCFMFFLVIVSLGFFAYGVWHGGLQDGMRHVV